MFYVALNFLGERKIAVGPVKCQDMHTVNVWLTTAEVNAEYSFRHLRPFILDYRRLD